MLVARMAPFTSTIFARRCPPGPAHRGDQPRPGDSRTPTARRRCSPTSPRTSPAGSTSTRRGSASPRCAAAVAEHQKRFYGLTVDPDHVLVTTGATEAIAAAVLALCGPGDEVVTFQPYYDSYAATVALPGPRCGRSRCAPPGASPSIRTSCAPRSPPAPAWCWSTPRTTRPARSSPASSSPTIGELAAEFDAVVVTDEVYEHMVLRLRRRARPDGRRYPAWPTAR